MFPAILAFFGAIFVIVLVHELGHLLAAKWTGMSASVFSIGFGRRLWGFRWRGTEYRISAIPLGGYVRVDPMEETVAGPRGPITRFDTYGWGPRALVISAGVAMNLLLALGIYAAIPLIWGAPEPAPLRIAAVRTESLPAGAQGWASLPADARVVSIDGRRLESVQDLYMAVAGALPGEARLELADGREVVVGVPEGDEGKLAVVRALVPGDAPVVGRVVEGGPAARAGLLSGDRILRVDGHPVGSWQSWEARVRDNPGRMITVDVRRGGDPATLRVTPERVAGPDGPVGAIGVIRGVPRSAPTPARTLAYAGASFSSTLDIIGESWVILLRGRLSARQVGGPVTVVSETVRIFRNGWEAFLGFVAFLSVNIAIINFLPIPALDGGYFAMLGVEAIRRRPVPAPVQSYLARVGLIWLSLIMAATVVNDVLRLTGR